MSRTMTICVALGAICVTYLIGQTHGRSDDSSQIAAETQSEITALQQRRIELLEQRVSEIESVISIGVSIDRRRLSRVRLDLLGAQLDYAVSVAEKEQLLTEMLQEYDVLIAGDEAALEAPRTEADDGTDLLEASSQLLLLKSERVRIEIELASLE